MEWYEVFRWLRQGERRRRVVVQIRQPSTAQQLARQTRLTPDSCSYALGELTVHELVRCLNEPARRSRLYWLTTRGKHGQQRLRELGALPPLRHDFPRVDWQLYGWVCFRHRTAILKALSEPLPPATIKRRARAQNPSLRMSANNVRDVIRLFLARGVVTRIQIGRAHHPRYQLTEAGGKLRQLLLRAEVGL